LIPPKVDLAPSDGIIAPSDNGDGLGLVGTRVPRCY
jgi:hypothetical protein